MLSRWAGRGLHHGVGNVRGRRANPLNGGERRVRLTMSRSARISLVLSPKVERSRGFPSPFLAFGSLQAAHSRTSWIAMMSCIRRFGVSERHISFQSWQSVLSGSSFSTMFLNPAMSVAFSQRRARPLAFHERKDMGSGPSPESPWQKER